MAGEMDNAFERDDKKVVAFFLVVLYIGISTKC